MELTLSAAAQATGRGKSTLLRAVKSGKLSAKRTEDGAYLVDASELARVFQVNHLTRTDEAPRHATIEPPDAGLAVLQTKVAMLEEQLAREREVSQDTIADLRKRLDAEQEERRALSRQLAPPATESRQEVPRAAPPVGEAPKPAAGLLRRLLGR